MSSGRPWGNPGFYDLVESITGSKHERHEEQRDWLGNDFDPVAISADRVNQVLLATCRRRKASRDSTGFLDCAASPKHDMCYYFLSIYPYNSFGFDVGI